MKKTRLRGLDIPRVIYHWSPRRRRQSIRTGGLKIGSLSVNRDWRPNYICLSDDPIRALCLCSHVKSGTMMDLYAVYPLLIHRVYRLQRDRQRKLIPEWRIYNTITTDRIYRIASRPIRKVRGRVVIDNRMKKAPERKTPPSGSAQGGGSNAP